MRRGLCYTLGHQPIPFNRGTGRSSPLKILMGPIDSSDYGKKLTLRQAALIAGFAIGILLLINGLGIITNSLQPYLYPNVRLEFLIITFYGEVFFMLWLLIKEMED